MVQNLKIKEQIEVLWDQQKARRSHQNWGALKMGKERAPGDGKVRVRDNRHQADRTSASMETTSRVIRACQTEEGIDIGIQLWLCVLVLST